MDRFMVTGTIFSKFPYNKFQVYKDGVLDPDAIYTRNTPMTEIVVKHQHNYESFSKGYILKPKRNAKPQKARNIVQDMKIPTGYYKVIFLPGQNGEPGKAIGFMLPHTFENMNLAADHYPSLSQKDAFWLFASRIDLIEETSGVKFSGVPAEQKHAWSTTWFRSLSGDPDNLRSFTCGKGHPQGVLQNSTQEGRIAACIDLLQ